MRSGDRDQLTAPAHNNPDGRSVYMPLYSVAHSAESTAQRLHNDHTETSHSVHLVSDDITVYDSIQELCALPSPHPSLLSRDQVHFIDGVYCPLRPCAWKEVLCLHEEDDDVLFILDGIVNGFKLVDPNAPIGHYSTDNYYSAAVSSRPEVNDIIMNKLSQGKLSVSDTTPVCEHAMGAVPKSTGVIRNITDCSRPKGLSINNYMKETFSTFRYKSMDDVVAFLSQGTYMAVTDIASAYRAHCTKYHDMRHSIY